MTANPNPLTKQAMSKSQNVLSRKLRFVLILGIIAVHAPYTHAGLFHTISGMVTDEQDRPIFVRVYAERIGYIYTELLDGHYSISVPHGYSGRVWADLNAGGAA